MLILRLLEPDATSPQYNANIGKYNVKYNVEVQKLDAEASGIDGYTYGS